MFEILVITLITDTQKQLFRFGAHEVGVRGRRIHPVLNLNYGANILLLRLSRTMAKSEESRRFSHGT